MSANTTALHTGSQAQATASETDSITAIITVFGLLFSIGILGSCMFTCAGYHRYRMQQRMRNGSSHPISFGPWIFNFGRRMPDTQEFSRIPSFGKSFAMKRNYELTQSAVSVTKERERTIRTKASEIDFKDKDAYEDYYPIHYNKSLCLEQEKMKTNMTERLKKVGQVVASENDVACKICFIRKCEVFLEPCGHVGICEPCTIKIFDDKKKCPFDQEPVTGYRIAYVV